MHSATLNGHVVIGHDDDAVGRQIRDSLLGEGYHVSLVHDRAAALDYARTSKPDVLIVSTAVAGAPDFGLCRQLRFDSATRLLPIVLTGTHAERNSRVRALQAGADDLVITPVDDSELAARIGSYVRLKRQTDEMDSATAIITTLAIMIEKRDGHSEGHCHRMANYSTALGRALGLPDADLVALNRGGFLHDIGMLAIPDSLLRNTGPLTAEEYALVQSHTVIGDELCGSLRSLQPIRPIVRSHHERLDGSGYPDRLRGNDVPLLAQIIGIADVFDGLTSPRAYHRQRPAAEAISILEEQVARGWRRHDLVSIFTDLLAQGRLGAIVV